MRARRRRASSICNLLTHRSPGATQYRKRSGRGQQPDCGHQAGCLAGAHWLFGQMDKSRGSVCLGVKAASSVSYTNKSWVSI